MDKNRYIAELDKLLSVFMTSADRAETARLYGAAFDAAGEAGLDALLARLGSPTRAAIRLSRTYEPGHIEDEALQAVAAAPEGEAPAGQTAPDGEGQAPAPEKKKPQGPSKFLSMPLDAPEDLPEEHMVTKRTMSLWAGVPLFILVLLAAGVPLLALLVALLAVLLLPGGAVFLAGWLTAVGGLWCISYIADAVLLFGAAFVLFGVGILLVWLAVWITVKLAKLWVRFLVGCKRLFLGRKVQEDA